MTSSGPAARACGSDDTMAGSGFFTFVNNHTLAALVSDSNAPCTRRSCTTCRSSKFVMRCIEAIDNAAWLDTVQEDLTCTLCREWKMETDGTAFIERVSSLPRAITMEMRILEKVCENKQFERRWTCLEGQQISERQPRWTREYRHVGAARVQKPP